jgi:high-affinity K+ transport system ATPase subunit B
MSLIPVYFFFEGLSDGSVDANNMGIWMIILLVIAAVMGGTWWLKNKNQVMAAKVILLVAAIPSCIAILFMAIVIGSDVRWN